MKQSAERRFISAGNTRTNTTLFPLLQDVTYIWKYLSNWKIIEENKKWISVWYRTRQYRGKWYTPCELCYRIPQVLGRFRFSVSSGVTDSVFPTSCENFNSRAWYKVHVGCRMVARRQKITKCLKRRCKRLCDQRRRHVKYLILLSDVNENWNYWDPFL
jgi:hypothetical protein